MPHLPLTVCRMPCGFLILIVRVSKVLERLAFVYFLRDVFQFQKSKPGVSTASTVSAVSISAISDLGIRDWPGTGRTRMPWNNCAPTWAVANQWPGLLHSSIKKKVLSCGFSTAQNLLAKGSSKIDHRIRFKYSI